MTRDVLIVGGGLGGTAAAIELARGGRSVHLLERHDGPSHKACGEFLSIEAQRHLAALGLDADALGASPIERIRLVAGGVSAETRLPFVARGLSRWRLDEALVERAENAGVHVERPVRAIELVDEGVRTDKGDRGGRFVMLATGKLGIRNALEQAPLDAHVGFKMHWRLPPGARARLSGLIELALFRGGYAGLQLVEDGIANLCLVLRRDRLAALGGRWEDVLKMVGRLSPGFRDAVQSEPLFAKPVTVANLPYGRVHAADGGECVYRLGDQGAMTASLTGDGMAIALRSGWLAARAVAEGLPPPTYQAWLKAVVGRQVDRGMWLQRLAEMGLLPVAGTGIACLCPALLRSLVGMTRLPDMEECA
jgi:flavin-dependent dehydrogenase